MISIKKDLDNNSKGSKPTRVDVTDRTISRFKDGSKCV